MKTPTDIHELPEHGLRLPGRTDAEWREFLIVADGWSAGYMAVRIDGAATELALYLYHAGTLSLPPDATIAELIEAAEECALAPLHRVAVSAPN